jgi:hypothetical protein
LRIGDSPTKRTPAETENLVSILLYLGLEKARLEAAVAVAAGKLRHRVAEITGGREGA